MHINPHNHELVRRLEIVVGHLRNAIDDAAEDFGAGLDHATIALDVLKQIVADGRTPITVPGDRQFFEAQIAEHEGLHVGDAVDVPSRTIGRSVIEDMWHRNAGPLAYVMARISNADGKALALNVSALEPAPDPDRQRKADRVDGSEAEAAEDHAAAIKRIEAEDARQARTPGTQQWAETYRDDLGESPDC